MAPSAPAVGRSLWPNCWRSVSRHRRVYHRAGCEPIRILRVIARLNVGGPALHVSYLTRELDKIGYETTLVAGVDRRQRGLDGVRRRGARGHSRSTCRRCSGRSRRSRISPPRASSCALIRRLRPDVLHTHTAKAGRGRAARGAARRARRGRESSSTRSTATSCAATSARRRRRRSGRLERGLARSSATRSSPSRRRCATTSSRSASRRAEKITVIRLGLDLEQRLATAPGAAEALRRRARRARRTGFLVAGSAA